MSRRGSERTPLHDRHVALGARMVPFARLGDARPVRGRDPRAPRRPARPRRLRRLPHGSDPRRRPAAGGAAAGLLSNDLSRLADGEAQYTLLTNERGGIVDDLIAYRIGPFHTLLVVNAGNREAAYGWLKEREIRGSEVRDASDEYALLAVQGPTAIAALGLPDAPAFTHAMGEVHGVEVMVCRTGYTGEAGVELMCAAEDAVELWDAVVANGTTPCGLGARDTLRLEVCYPLHGNDITGDTDAISAGLGWTCALDKEFSGVGGAAPDQGRGAGHAGSPRS